MVKGKANKIISLILILIFILSIASPVYADKKLVVDQAELFAAEEEAVLRKDASALGEKYNMDIVIVTTEDAGGKSSREYADDYFDQNGYGVGENRDGILFLLDFDNREAYISTCGSGIKYLTDERIERILDDVFSSGLTDGDNYGAAKAFLESTGNFLAAGIPDNQQNVPVPAADTEVSSYTGKELVADQAELYTAEEEAVLRKEAGTLGEKYHMDIVIVTTSDAGGKSSKDYAHDYFIDNGYGVGEDRDGILFLLDSDNEEVRIFTYGSGMKYLTDERLQRLLDDVFSGGLTEGDVYGAANAFLESTGNFLAAGIPDNQQNVPVPVENTLSIAEAVIGAIIAGIIGLFFYWLTKSNYDGIPTSSIFDYRKNSFVNMEIMDDSLVNTYITTRVIPKADPPSTSSSNRSSTHRSSSGSSHGGGGRSFSGGSTTHRSSSGSSHGGGGRKF